MRALGLIDLPKARWNVAECRVFRSIWKRVISIGGRFGCSGSQLAATNC